MIDIGANLSHESFSHDLEQIISDAKACGIEQIVVTGASLEGSRQALQLARQWPGYLWATAGVHPHDAMNFDDAACRELAQLAADHSVVSLGETGLDFHRDFSPRDQQEAAFAAQLDLAVSVGKPLFLHQRDAHTQFMNLLKPRLPQLKKVVVHCFTGSEAELEEYLQHDLYIGITGWICDERRGHHLHDLLERIPANRLMIETDSPYLMPRTIRPRPKSRRNVPANLPWIVQTIAECLGTDKAQVEAQTTLNAREFFGLVAPASTNKSEPA